jgi:hypothetical protein
MFALPAVGATFAGAGSGSGLGRNAGRAQCEMAIQCEHICIKRQGNHDRLYATLEARIFPMPGWTGCARGLALG